MNVDVEIYMNNLVKFFNENPKDLASLIPYDKKEEFFDKVKQIVSENVNKGEDATLTRKQLIDLCVELNQQVDQFLIKKEGPLLFTKFGLISLN
jgi:hypothetical protein